MKIDDIDAFVAVIRNASLSQAAESLGLTQSAITRRVQSLEESLGVALLDRNTKPLKPTASGLQVYEQCRRVLREVDGLRELVAGDATPSGVLRLGVPQSIGWPTSTRSCARRSALAGAAICWRAWRMPNWTRQWCCFRQARYSPKNSAPRP